MPERQIIGPLLLALLCLVALMQCAPPVKAQSAATASADAALPLTPGSACGAPGVGIRRVDGAVVREAAGIAGWHVDPDGGWTTCTMPPPPADCEFGRREWQAGGRTCTHWTFAPATLQHGKAYVLRTGFGPLEGMAVYRCDAGRLQTIMAACRDTTQCEGSYTGVRNDAVYRWGPGALPLGAVAQAVAEGGAAITITCDAGQLRQLPQQ